MIKKIIVIVAIVLAAAIVVTGSALGIYYGAVNKTTVKVHYDENETFQTFAGFGASSCWNFRLFGENQTEEEQDKMIEMTYGDTGLKLNIFRYNLGGGSLEVEECHYGERNKTASFFIAENYVDNTSFEKVENYDFTKDAEYFAMFKKAILTGNVTKLIIFSNSPHYLLTENGLTNSTVAGENNLPEKNFKAHSIYTLIATKHFKEKLVEWGYPDIEILISPVNEPQWSWGGEGAVQEGCHYDPDHLAKFYDVFYKELTAFNAANGTDFKMDMYESGNYYLGVTEKSKNKKYLNEFDKYDYFKNVEELSMHSYKADIDKPARSRYYKYLTNRYDGQKKIIMSEYCVMVPDVDMTPDMGIYSSQVLIRDLTLLNVEEWTWWLAVAYGGWEDGLVYYNEETKEFYTSYRYHMYKNFMAYIEPGDVRIKADVKDYLGWGELDSVAFKKPDGSIVMVVVNGSDKARNLNVENLKGYTSIKKVVTAENEYLNEEDMSFTNQLTVKANSVTTFVITK